MQITRLDWIVRFDRRQAGGRYIRLVWWRLNWGWMPKLLIDAYDAEWWWILTFGPLWLEISPKPCSWEDN